MGAWLVGGEAPVWAASVDGGFSLSGVGVVVGWEGGVISCRASLDARSSSEVMTANVEGSTLKVEFWAG